MSASQIATLPILLPVPVASTLYVGVMLAIENVGVNSAIFQLSLVLLLSVEPPLPAIFNGAKVLSSPFTFDENSATI